MAETERPASAWSLGVQAGGFIGLFLGFSLAVVSALTDPDALVRLVQLMCITPVACALLSGRSWASEGHPTSPTWTPSMRSELGSNPSTKVKGSGAAQPCSERRSNGSHRPAQLNSTLTIVASTLELAEEHPIRYIVGRGEARSRDPELRGTVLAYIEEHVMLNRRRRTSSSVEVLPPSVIEHMEATHRMHRRLFYLLPIILFFAWLEMR